MTPAEYVNSAKCYLCLGMNIAQALRLAKLRNIALTLDPNMDTTPQALMEEGKCFNCLGMTVGELMEIVLLNRLEVLIQQGGTGASCMLCGDGDPTADPTPCTCAWYVNRLNSQAWYWDARPGHQRWYQFG